MDGNRPFSCPRTLQIQEKRVGLQLLCLHLWMAARWSCAASLCVLVGTLGALPFPQAQADPPHPPPPGHHGPPGPPGPERDPKRLQQRIADIRRGISQVRGGDPMESEIASFGMNYLERSEQALRSAHLFTADRLLGAADACRHVLDHLNRIRQGSKNPPPPPPQAISDHLRQVYFRLRLSDFFLHEIPDPKPERLPTLARQFYQSALQAYQASHWLAADEYTKCADDITHALENLAQAAIPAPAVRRVS
ncbi:MAG: hypothetical protein ACR2JB_07260 [Bryobacteraceae bacterium]